MPIELLPHLRLLSLHSMRLGPSTQSSLAVPILSRMFPFKLRYYALGHQFRNELRVRRLSTRPFRPRAGSSSEFGRGGRDKGVEVRASKSLIDDEAELSDWVSNLRKTDSFRGRIASDDDDMDDRLRGRGKSRDRGGERNRDSFSMKRRRESESDELHEPSRGRARSSYEVRNQGSFAMKTRRESDSGQRSRGRTSNSFDSRYPKGTKRFDSRSNGGRGTRDSGLGNRQRKLKQSSDDDDLGGIDDEELQRLRVGFQDLLSENTDEESDDDEDEDDNVLKNRGSLYGMDKEVRANGTPSSPGKSGSYLSETR